MMLGFSLLWGTGCTSSSSTNSNTEECSNSFPAYSFTVDESEDHHGHGHSEEASNSDDSTDDSDVPVFLPARESLLPERLSETALYTDIVNGDIHPALLGFTPAYQLWSDGEAKDRWAYIPECEKIDSSDMNNWHFPVGTRWFKEFSQNGQKIETRLVTRIGTGPRDFAYASYQWNEAQTEAIRVPEEGVRNVNGSSHNIPSKSQCLQCHGSYSFGGGRPSRGLGFSALQLNHEATDTTLSMLVSNDKLSHPPVAEITFPGDEKTQQALGYLHANCGNCHNDSKDGLPHNDLNLWLDVEVVDPEESGAWKTAVNQPTATFKDQHISGRIVAGNPTESAVLYRMSHRGNNAQMPPVATQVVDEEGLSIIREWIESLP